MTEAIKQARAALDAANTAYLSELEADSKRSDGSGSQEARREGHQQELREEIERCEIALKQAEAEHVSSQSTA